MIKQEGYLKPFSDRSLHKCLREQEKMAIDYECFYKSFRDPLDVDDIDEFE